MIIFLMALPLGDYAPTYAYYLAGFELLLEAIMISLLISIL
jgi:hypothetical protein